MRFTCEKSMLVQGLNIAGRTVASKSTLTAIEGILCKAGIGLNLTGYNMETAITYQIDADVASISAQSKLYISANQSVANIPSNATSVKHRLSSSNSIMSQPNSSNASLANNS